MLRHVAFSTESPQEQDSLGRKRYLPEKKKLTNEKYYLPYLGFRAVGEWFDSLGNLPAILSGVADAERTATILYFIEPGVYTSDEARDSADRQTCSCGRRGPAA